MLLKNFAIIKGNGAIIDNGQITLPASKKSTPGEGKSGERPNIEIRTDATFSNGTIEFRFKTNNHSTGIYFLFQGAKDNEYVIGISRYYDAFIIGESTNKVTPISKAGSLRNYDLGAEHQCRIEIKGSIAQLYMNNILMCESAISIKESPIAIRFNSLGELKIFDIKLHSTKPKIFVVMQFTKDYNELFEDVIKPITEQAGFECIRADEFYTSTPILNDIIESIQDSMAIIAEITPDNPNVFYEIGYSHAINKPTILLCDKKREKLPFDISSFRTLMYENTIAGKKKVEESLKMYLANIK